MRCSHPPPSSRTLGLYSGLWVRSFPLEWCFIVRNHQRPQRQTLPYPKSTRHDLAPDERCSRSCPLRVCPGRGTYKNLLMAEADADSHKGNISSRRQLRLQQYTHPSIPSRQIVPRFHPVGRVGEHLQRTSSQSIPIYIPNLAATSAALPFDLPSFVKLLADAAESQDITKRPISATTIPPTHEHSIQHFCHYRTARSRHL